MKPLIVFAFAFLCCKQIVLSQQVNGHWFGVGKVTVPGEHSAYMAEMILQQKGSTVTGELQYYFRDSLFKVSLSGQFNKNTRQLNLKPIPFIYYLSRSTKNGIDCILKGHFTLIVNRNESLLNGAFESRRSTPLYNTCYSVSFQVLYRYRTQTRQSKRRNNRYNHCW